MLKKGPPVLATWLLMHLGCNADIEAVLGDLAERYWQGHGSLPRNGSRIAQAAPLKGLLVLLFVTVLVSQVHASVGQDVPLGMIQGTVTLEGGLTRSLMSQSP